MSGLSVSFCRRRWPLRLRRVRGEPHLFLTEHLSAPARHHRHVPVPGHRHYRDAVVLPAAHVVERAFGAHLWMFGFGIRRHEQQQRNSGIRNGAALCVRDGHFEQILAETERRRLRREREGCDVRLRRREHRQRKDACNQLHFCWSPMRASNASWSPLVKHTPARYQSWPPRGSSRDHMTFALHTTAFSPAAIVTLMSRFGFTAEDVNICAPVSDRSTSLPVEPSICTSGSGLNATRRAPLAGPRYCSPSGGAAPATGAAMGSGAGRAAPAGAAGARR